MIASVDAYYRGVGAVAACVLFEPWTAEKAIREIVRHIEGVEPYEPGLFYKRELPCILAVLKEVHDPLEAIVVDGYAWLRLGEKPGLGAKLYEALEGKVPVIGVAKARFVTGSGAVAVYRGRSRRPLFVTAAGMTSETAAGLIAIMHGCFRIPAMLKRVDQLCRSSDCP